jgi:hypothetical protein
MDYIKCGPCKVKPLWNNHKAFTNHKQSVDHMLAKLFETSTHHLYGTDVLFLFHIDVCYVQPNITELCRCFTDLGKYVTSFIHAALMGKHSTYNEHNLITRLLIIISQVLS